MIIDGNYYLICVIKSERITEITDYILTNMQYYSDNREDM